MKKFAFPLQAILTLRELKQEQALETYARSVQDCAAKRSEMLVAARRTDSLEALLGRDDGAPYSASMRSAYLRALDASREEVVRKEKVLSDAEKAKDKNLVEYLDRKRKREILENLREKKARTHVTESLRHEEIEIEDLVISRRGTVRIAS
jgi:flagellar export protein FliJ